MSSRRVTVVASELLGRSGTGGAGTADSLLAVALARAGHHVELVIASGRDVGRLNDEWRQAYDEAGVQVSVLETIRGVEPEFLRPPYEVYLALREQPPEVVVVDDWRALAFLCLRARQTGSGFAQTAFVVHCHGVARVLAAFAGKVPDTLARFGEEVAERASLALADAVISPSEWLLGWLRDHGWPLPASARVVPYLRQSAVFGATPPPPRPLERIRRLAFFGQLREGKGVRIYLDALATLEPTLLDGVELGFLGAASKRWNAATITAHLGPALVERAGGLRFETELDRTAALRELRQPGTLAVMPSLLDNAPNTVSECVEYGIPFLSTATGGIPELVAARDRERVLCEPTARSLASALERVLREPAGFAPAQAPGDPVETLERWLELIASIRPPGPPSRAPARADVEVVVTSGRGRDRAEALARASARAAARVLHAESTGAALERASADWLLFLDDEDVPDPELLDRLIAAQQAAGADAVTTAVRTAEGSIRLFLGEPGSLGLVENHYGVIGVARRSLVDPMWSLDEAQDPEWVVFSRLALAGASIVSLPDPLSTHLGHAGAVGDVPGDGVAVLEAFEPAMRSTRVSDLPQLAATLAAARADTQRASLPRVPARLAWRGLRVLREEGPAAVLRRLRGRLPRGR